MTVLLLVLLVFVAAVACAALRAQRALARRLESTVRSAVFAALAEEREREITEARAFWAEQEARAEADAIDPLSDSLIDGNALFLPAPRGYVDEEGTLDPEFADALKSALEEMITDGDRRATAPHPAQPGFVPQPTPTPEWTDLRLMELVDVGTALRDVRPGPMGTLDVYVFEDETTLCIAPGDAETGARIREAVDRGEDVRLLGSSRLPGAHALTFALGEETVYVLADRVVASL